MASAYLTKTFSGAGNTKKWTFSAWVKKSKIANNATLFHAKTTANTNFESIILTSGGNFDWEHYEYTSSAYKGRLKTNRLFRDSSAWYHIVCVFDSANATAGDRMKLYVNGTEETSFSIDTNPTQNQDSIINAANAHNIGSSGTSLYFDGNMTHIHFTDGYAYDADDFGESDSTSGIWKPKTAPSVTYGTNGFFLKMENSGAMGTDSSGNSNTFTVSGTLTQNVDTPSNNFATLNPNHQSTYHSTSRATLANGNTKWTGTSNGTSQNGIISTLGASKGKFYLEAKWVGTADATIGVAKDNFGMMTAGTGGLQSTGWYGMNTNISASGGAGMAWWSNNSATGDRGSTISNNDIIMMAIDIDNNKLYFGINGTWEESGDPTSGATGTGATSTLASNTTYLVACANYGNLTANSWEFNFGQGYFGTTAVASAGTAPSEGGIFEYDCPSGYQALCTKGINSF